VAGGLEATGLDGGQHLVWREGEELHEARKVDRSAPRRQAFCELPQLASFVSFSNYL
jgi:hypothetical protein